MKGTTATTDQGVGVIRAQVHEVGPQNIAALAELLGQGNGVYMVTVHKRRIVKYARVEPEVKVSVAEAGKGEGGPAG